MSLFDRSSQSKSSFRVVGQPAAHSLSPRIHQKFAQDLGLSIDYQIQELPLGGFESGIQKLLEEGISGFSVTLPFKREAYAMAEVLTPRAQTAHAVNTLWLSQGKLYGDNTDGVGFLNDVVLEQKINLENQKVLILGAGGSALGIMGPLLDAHAEVKVFSRRGLSLDHPLKAWELMHLEQENLEHFDLVINATDLQFQTRESQEASKNLWRSDWIHSNTLAYDLSYVRGHSAQTVFMEWALQNGAIKTVDGLGMLIEQAALQFEIFMGLLPSRETIKNLKYNVMLDSL